MTKVYLVEQDKLTSDCWMIQIQGIEACRGCEFLGKKECGGKAIRKRIFQDRDYPSQGIGKRVERQSKGE